MSLDLSSNLWWASYNFSNQIWTDSENWLGTESRFLLSKHFTVSTSTNNYLHVPLDIDNSGKAQNVVWHLLSVQFSSSKTPFSNHLELSVNLKKCIAFLHDMLEVWTIIFQWNVSLSVKGIINNKQMTGFECWGPWNHTKWVFQWLTLLLCFEHLICARKFPKSFLPGLSHNYPDRSSFLPFCKWENWEIKKIK
jgi:hypothetical protein